MNPLKITLLIIGIIGTIFCTYGLIANTFDIITFMGLVCSVCLVYAGCPMKTATKESKVSR